MKKIPLGHRPTVVQRINVIQKALKQKGSGACSAAQTDPCDKEMQGEYVITCQ